MSGLRAGVAPGLRLERKHLNALVCAMRYLSFDELRAQGRAHPLGLRGLGDQPPDSHGPISGNV